MEVKVCVTFEDGEHETPRFVALCNFIGPEKHVKKVCDRLPIIHEFRMSPIEAEKLFEQFNWVRTVEVTLERSDFEAAQKERAKRQKAGKRPRKEEDDDRRVEPWDDDNEMVAEPVAPIQQLPLPPPPHKGDHIYRTPERAAEIRRGTPKERK